jgi:hypothetical protein
MQRYPLTPIEASCPVCCGRECEVLYCVDTDQAARHLLGDRADEQYLSELKSRIARLWQASACGFLRCKTCGFCFASPHVSGDAEFYSMVYADAHYAPWKWEFQLAYDALQERANSGPTAPFRLLEIGAGDGSFVKRLSPSLIPRERVLCVEYSDSGANEIARYGIKCLKGDLGSAEFSPYRNCFDVICMFHVLEHMDDVHRVFECITGLAANRADLFIAVPNAKQREILDHSGVKLDVPPVHIGRWNRRCFEIMAERHGWVLVSHEVEPPARLEELRRFLYYQVSRTDVVRPLRRVRSRPVRRLALSAMLPIRVLSTLPAMLALMARDAGVSQLAHLRRGSGAPR